ncbi:MAG: insulinase family protein [Bacteroidales bacterium]|nr:insulinase family protein [Bacteroidales bacterium]
MKLIKNYLLGLLLLIPICSFSQPTLKNETIKQLVLNNGLTVILDEHHAQPEVFGLVIVKTGGKNDPSDATGMAHYQEHMLFKGTTDLGTVNWEKEKPHIDRIFALYDSLGQTKDATKRAEIQKRINEESVKANEYAIPNELSNLLNEMGSSRINASTGPDQTVFFNKFPSNQIERWLDLYAHRFEDPVFRGFQAELEVVYEEKNLYNDQFQTKLLEEFQKHFFKHHPYGQQTLIGTVEDLKNPSLTKMYQFFKTYYVPNNMALILSGDFNTDEVISMIEEKFGQWKEKELPTAKTWDEEPFNGREFYQAKLTPVKVGLLGYRAPSVKDDQSLLVEVLASIFNNSYSTGLLDKLSVDGKLLAAESFEMPYQDYGALLVLFVPKIVGQSLENAEKLVHAEIEKVKNGNFDDSLLEAIKLEKYRIYVSNMENIENRAMLLGEAFSNGKSIDDMLSYPDKIKSITKADVVKMANEIFGPNYLAFYSKMGFPKKEKIAKPDFKPLIANANARSKYAEHLDSIPTKAPTFKTIDFNRDVETLQLKGNSKICKVENPYNDVFSLTVRYNVGEGTIPMLKFASFGIPMCGAENYTLDQLKQEFAKIGTTFWIWTNDNNTSIEVKGIEANLPKTIELLGLLMKNPKLEQAKVKTIISDVKADRKMERSEPDNVAYALYQYGLYGEKSNFIDRFSMKDIKKLKANEVTDAFKDAANYGMNIYFAGKSSLSDIASLVEKDFPISQTSKVNALPEDKPVKQYSENTILLVNKPNARQSKVYLLINGEPFNIEDAVSIEAFNDYFGNGFSGLILQEIREYRSLAYSAGGSFRLPKVEGSPVNFIGYVGTQSDKTLTAMETFDSLIRQMPQKPERLNMIKNHLELSAQTNRPTFRNLAIAVDQWKKQGYSIDPVLYKQPQYKAIDWNTIEQFYNSRIKSKPVVFMIVGDEKQINKTELSKYGKIITIKEKKLFKK